MPTIKNIEAKAEVIPGLSSQKMGNKYEASPEDKNALANFKKHMEMNEGKLSFEMALVKNMMLSNSKYLGEGKALNAKKDVETPSGNCKIGEGENGLEDTTSAKELMSSVPQNMESNGDHGRSHNADDVPAGMPGEGIGIRSTITDTLDGAITSKGKQHDIHSESLLSSKELARSNTGSIHETYLEALKGDLKHSQVNSNFSLKEVDLTINDTITVIQQSVLPTVEYLLRTQIDKASASMNADISTLSLPHADVDPLISTKEIISVQLHIKSLDNAKIDIALQDNILKVNFESQAGAVKAIDLEAVAELRLALEQKYPNLQVQLAFNKDSLVSQQLELSQHGQTYQEDGQHQHGHDSERDRDNEHPADSLLAELIEE